MRTITLILLCLGGSLVAFTQNGYLVKNNIHLKKTSTSKLSKSENERIISFNLLGGLIMVDTEIDGEKSKVIFDTGAPSIIINKKNSEIKNPDAVGVGVNGKMNVKSKIVQHFEMGLIIKKNLPALEVDISHIEKMKKEKISGILGIGAYSEEEVLVDYKKQMIELLPRHHKKKLKNKSVIASVPFYMEEQLPVIKVKIGNRNFYFGVDTGAEINVINSKSLKKLKKCKIKKGACKSIAGVNPGKNVSQTINVDEIKIKKQHFKNQEFVSLDLSTFNRSNGFKIDGILGYPFLKENLVSFDFRRSKLNFWKEVIFEKILEGERFVESGLD